MGEEIHSYYLNCVSVQYGCVTLCWVRIAIVAVAEVRQVVLVHLSEQPRPRC
jgi:hypothetical protein